ncbi:fatty acid efflux MMPL transporter FarE [Sporosarcina sp. NCCP-2716]|uniref:MMPL family transporter n=1 Tax=Sporosarcina sp. NCCP-2716 TaxID=2943679 RepID=UPI00207FD2D6|nr:MMPL family transporter [Sporosarcina sp. NCCP-2716]GKV68907.1 fatty acid efflux MMPL transporter FarE [Sporosarcina sp. NCCP-2716]
MAKLLYRLGSFIARNKWWVIVIWIALLAAIVTPLISNAPEFSSDIKMNGLKSIDTNDKIREEFHFDSERASIRIVFHTNANEGITDPSLMQDIQQTLADIKKNDDYVASITDPYENRQINADQNTAFADITYVVSQTSLKDASLTNVKKELSDLKDQHNVQTELTGNALTDIEFGGASEAIGVLIAFVILVITFGSLVAAGLPIVSAILGLGTSIGIIALLTHVFTVPNVTLTLAVMIGLAVGIDYALFILSRYREIIRTEPDHVKAIGLAVGTAGSAIIFAGVTVIIAVCGLALIGIDFLAVMGFMSAISVLLAVVSALTLLPALISLFHLRVRPKPDKLGTTRRLDTPWSKFVIGKPWLAVILGIVILAATSIPMANMRLGIPDDGMKPDDSTQKKAYDLISDEFGEGFNGQIPMLVNVKGKSDTDAVQRDLKRMTDDLMDISNVDIVTPAQLNESQTYALLSILPKEGPNAQSTQTLVHDLRDYDAKAKDKYDFETEISGQSVINIDMSKKLNDAIPVFAGIIIVLAFVLLMIVFRSILIPLKAVLGFVLSLTATLGFTTLVMQEGFLGSLFGVGTTGPLLAFLPVIVIGLLFGLAIDYEIFLMSRVYEEYSRTKDNVRSIQIGLKESGSVIIAAALIMFSVFMAFVFQDDVMIKSLGIALAFGVLFDAFIVRLTLIPALTKLFGPMSWYMPKWLDRLLPKVDIEGHALQDERTPQPMDAPLSEAPAAPAFAVTAEGAFDGGTQQLYEELLRTEPERPVLFEALLLYAKTHAPEIYRAYSPYVTEEDEAVRMDSTVPERDQLLAALLGEQTGLLQDIRDVLAEMADRDTDRH